MERINEPSEPHSELCRIPSYLKNKKRPETSKILLLFYNTVNNTILCFIIVLQQYCKKNCNTAVYNSLMQGFFRLKMLNSS